MWTSQKQVGEIEGAAKALAPFVSDTLASLDPGELENEPWKRPYAIYYLYGAVMYLADYDGIHNSSTRTLVENLLREFMDVGQSEFEELIPETAAHEDSSREKFFMIEGASALRHWMTNDEKSSARYLKVLLDDPQLAVVKNDSVPDDKMR